MAQEVAGSRPVTRPNFHCFSTFFSVTVRRRRITDSTLMIANDRFREVADLPPYIPLIGSDGHPIDHTYGAYSPPHEWIMMGSLEAPSYLVF